MCDMDQPRGRRVRMKDVAEHAGVSTRTVSNVVNEFVHVRPETRALVRRSIDELGYQMDYMARGLRSGRTGFIALVVPNLSEPYFAELAEAVVRSATKHRLNVLVEATGGDPEVELNAMRGSLANVADGILLSPVAATITGNLAGPVVLLGERASTRKLRHVGIDNVAAAQEVVRHLIDQGCRRIAALGVQDSATARLRYDGFSSAVAASRKAKPVILDTDEWSPRAGFAAVNRMLEATGPRPDGIFAFNDSLAIGALRALNNHRIGVPDEIAVAGIDNVTQAEFTQPSLTTVAPDLDDLADQAVRLLLDQLAGRTTERRLRSRRVPFRLIVRESSRRRPG